MKLGFGLYKHMLTTDNFRFARQAGATHLVVHLVDYFNKAGINNQPVGDRYGWGHAGDPNKLWQLDELVALKKAVESEGLTLHAIENFDPAHWFDILLDGPKRSKQIENIKTIIRNLGQAGISVIGYNFSIAGVCGRVQRTDARGGANTVGMSGVIPDEPIPNGMVWNMVYDSQAPTGSVKEVSQNELWQRLERFLNDVLPVAEEAGVTLAAHPDDPPVPKVRNSSRLVFQPDMYDRLIDINNSPANCLEYCLGSLAEMTSGNIYETTERYASLGRIGYIHFRNVQGKVPYYKEVFIDEGDIDLFRILRILRKHNYEGVLIPDHTPLMTCEAPWHSGMAYAMGYMKAALKMVEQESNA